MTADLDLKRDSENFYDTPASVYNIKNNFKITKVFWKLILFKAPVIRIHILEIFKQY